MCIHLHGRMPSSNTVAGDVPNGVVPNNIDQMNERQLFAHMTVDMLYADM